MVETPRCSLWGNPASGHFPAKHLEIEAVAGGHMFTITVDVTAKAPDINICTSCFMSIAVGAIKAAPEYELGGT